MANKITCTCGHSWDKSSSSKKDATICHICGKNIMKNGGWLDRYDDGGSMQEHQENYNNESVHVSPDYVGTGYDITGRTYSPAWGGQFQLGGSLPGSVGFTYARTKNIPSNGPYAKKTKASAQNGKEMSFYQNGFDWDAKTISQDGTAVKKQPRDMRTLAERKADEAKALDAKLRAQQPSLQKASSPINDERRRQLNEQYAQQSGKRYNPTTGSIEDRFSPQQDRMLNRAYENIVEPMIDAEMIASTAAPLVGKGVKALAKGLKNIGKEYLENKAAKKAAKNFKSEIDWGKWNSEIPENQSLIKEYEAIEKTSKANNSWMKNPDGSEFTGTPEQFVQQNSENFKKSFPEGHNRVYRGGNNEDFTNRSHPIVFTGDKNIAEHYVGGKNPFTGEYEIATPNTRAGRALFDFYHPKNTNSLIINNEGRSWREIPRKYFGDSPPPRDLHNPKGDFTSTDDIAEWMVANDKNSVRLNNIFDGYDADFVDIINNKPGNYLKSATGNNGMFDMTNPNIYKSVLPYAVPAAIGGAAALQQKKQGGKITKDNNGYWNPNNWGKPVEIGSNNITMQGVHQPLIGISDEGDVQYMQPGEHYKFKGKKVVEYPVKKNGGWLEKYN